MERLTPSSPDNVVTRGVTSPHGFKPKRVRIGSRLTRGGQQNRGMIRSSNRVVEQICSREKKPSLIICDSPVQTLFDSPDRPFVGPSKFVTVVAQINEAIIVDETTKTSIEGRSKRAAIKFLILRGNAVEIANANPSTSKGVNRIFEILPEISFEGGVGRGIDKREHPKSVGRVRKDKNIYEIAIERDRFNIKAGFPSKTNAPSFANRILEQEICETEVGEKGFNFGF